MGLWFLWGFFFFKGKSAPAGLVICSVSTGYSSRLHLHCRWNDGVPLSDDWLHSLGNKTSLPITPIFCAIHISSRCKQWLPWKSKCILMHAEWFHSQWLFCFILLLWLSYKKINIHQQPSSFHIIAICLYKIHPHMLNRQIHNVALIPTVISAIHGDSCSPQ